MAKKQVRIYEDDKERLFDEMRSDETYAEAFARVMDGFESQED